MKKTNSKTEISGRIISYLKKCFAPLILCIALIFPSIQTIFSHGTVTSPPSRVWICFQENPESPDSPACIDAVAIYGTQALYDWNEVARMDANGMHQAIIADGNLASAGRPDKYGGLDQVRDDWIATPVTPGPFTVTWTNSAPHQTLYYRVYITKESWTPDQPLTWDSLELLVETEPREASATDNIDVVLPARTGKHVIYSIWQRSLTEEAFYSTSDVDFGQTTEPKPPVALFTSDNGRCGGPDVEFDASDSFDPNGDTLTYSWDFGDGTTAEGVNVSHSYTGQDSAIVTLTVSDGVFSSGVVQTIDLVVDTACEEIICPFDTPRATPLPSVNDSYSNIYVLGDSGPNLDNIANCSINWDLGNNGLYQFSLSTNNGIPNWYNDLIEVSTQNFNAAGSLLTITGSSFVGLDGSYYATLDGDNLVLVSTTGDFTIYFSNSDIAPLCGDIIDPVNTAPVATLTATPTTGVTPLDVVLDASESTDADGDTLTYSINYGDGTSGTEAISTHTYTTGDYTATITVSDGNGGTDTASVMITVTDDIIINPPTGDCSFGAPTETSLVSINTSYENIYVLGTGGPNMDTVNLFTLNWNLANNGLYQFSFNLDIAPWYIDFSNAIQNFNESNPQISLINTGIPGLDGDYFVIIDERNFVLVAKDYSIYFSNATTAPTCETEVNRENEIESTFFEIFPNPATTSVSVKNTTDLKNSIITISDLSGKKLKSLTVPGSTTEMKIDISGIKSGLYLVRILDRSGNQRSLKLVIN
ncbi:Por secretion system C-terminal sorting domain-containing protein [Aquimarina amphilecti]|uniref:Por secretion system C-terminal sorting domain-containing protein n=1 Tax=Aquimarina amphilecti TaxID=1038014 RepID=A0A1H7HG27_AQUAM|nr:lytic polysaccharide monooxygenase [Aquimarina amphilecti]SEK47205.1 Por secretion system C-terminal sorting domain-containing protein [Aquimarina amphilecti]